MSESAAPILAAITVNYRRPANWPETMRVELFAERIGNKSLTLGHRIHVGERSRACSMPMATR